MTSAKEGVMQKETTRKVTAFAADNWFRLCFIALLLVIAYELLQISDDLESLCRVVSQLGMFR